MILPQCRGREGFSIFGGFQSNDLKIIIFCAFQLWCCGLTNYTDWQGTPWGRGHPDKLPYSCCQFTFKGVCAANDESAFMHTTVRNQWWCQSAFTYLHLLPGLLPTGDELYPGQRYQNRRGSLVCRRHSHHGSGPDLPLGTQHQQSQLRGNQLRASGAGGETPAQVSAAALL